MILGHIRSSFRETFPGRASEWALAVMLLNWSVVLSWNDTLFATSPAFSAFGLLITQPNLSLLCAVVAVLRLLVLAINGAWHRTPHLRAMGAFFGAGFWFLILIALIQSGEPTTGLAIYPVLLLLDSYNVIRSAGEAGIADLHHRRKREDADRV